MKKTDESQDAGSIPAASKQVCAMPCTVFSRVVGYYSPIKYWNNAKKQEFKDRNYLTLEDEDD